jgi:hypothetical protein
MIKDAKIRTSLLRDPCQGCTAQIQWQINKQKNNKKEKQ